MPQPLLFILLGAALYATIANIIAANRGDDTTRLHLFTASFGLAVIVMGLGYLGTQNARTPDSILNAGTVVIGAGILAWGLLPWIFSDYSRQHRPLSLTLLSSGWLLLFVLNLVTQPSLLYSGWIPPANPLLAAANPAAWQAVVNPLWWTMQVMIGATLVYTAYALTLQFRSGQHKAALTMAPVGILMANVWIWDLLVAIGLIEGIYLTVACMLLTAACLAILTTTRQPLGQRNAFNATEANRVMLTLPVLQMQTAPPAAVDTPAPLNLSFKPARTFTHFPRTPEPVESIPHTGIEPASATTASVIAHEDDTAPTESPKIRQELSDMSVYTKMLNHYADQDAPDPRAIQLLCERLNQRLEAARHITG